VKKKSAPELEPCSPIPFRTGSNGEFVPRPETAQDRRAEAMYRALVDDRSRKLGVSRRDFIHSASGTAAALLVINQVYGCGGKRSKGEDGRYAVDEESTLDEGKACEELEGDELVIDVQTHHVNPRGAWREDGSIWEAMLARFPYSDSCTESDDVDCYDTDHFIREIFLNSDTAVAVLSAVPSEPDDMPLTPDEAAETRAIVNKLAGSSRLLIHGLVLPHAGESQLEGMQRLAEELAISAWKVYPQWGGWWLDGDIGRRFIERARSLGVKMICAHKGLPFANFDPEHASSRDMGVAAAAYPDTTFICYHSNYHYGYKEGPYDADRPRGVDQLIKTFEDNGFARNTGNLYAELGSTWRAVMTSPTRAAHVLGKLLKHMGEDRVLWGTDSIWYGSPQDQIAAFRAFEIPAKLQEEHGYPALTPAIKAKILGLNAARVYDIDIDATRCKIREDALAARKRAAMERPLPRLRDFGPRTRREFFAFLHSRGGAPG
jgi:uncharacterized protein